MCCDEELDVSGHEELHVCHKGRQEGCNGKGFLCVTMKGST